VADARRHGITVLRPDVNRSGVMATVERTGPTPAGGEPRLVPTPSGSLPLPERGGAGDQNEPGERVGSGDRAGPGERAGPDGRSLVVRQGLASVRGVG